ncbi:MAG: LCP family protein [Armatimonadota bacterium]
MKRFARLILILLAFTGAIIAAVGKPICVWATRHAVGELPAGNFSTALVCLDYSEARTDVIRVLTVNQATGKAAMIKMYRDLEWWHNGRTHRLNSAWQFGGPDATLRAIREVSGLTVDHIIVLRIKDAEKMVDSLGGLTMDLPSISWKGWTYRSGVQAFSGDDVVKIFRTRHGIDGGDGSDIGRTALQDRVLACLLVRLRSLSPIEMRRVAGVISGVQSDLSQRRRLQLALALKDASMRQFAIPYTVAGPRLQAVDDCLSLWREHIAAWLAAPGDIEPVVTVHDPDVVRPRVLLPHPATEKQKELASYLGRHNSAAVVADVSVPGVTLVEKEISR